METAKLELKQILSQGETLRLSLRGATVSRGTSLQTMDGKSFWTEGSTSSNT